MPLFSLSQARLIGLRTASILLRFTRRPVQNVKLFGRQKRPSFCGAARSSGGISDPLGRDPQSSKTRLGHPRGSTPTMTVHVDPAALWDSRRCATHQQSVRRAGLSAPSADHLWSATASGRRAATDGEPAPPQRGKRPLVLHKHAPTRRNRPRHRHPSAGSRRDYTNYP